MENYAVNLAKKIREPNLDVKMTKEVKNELSSNICSICLELMIPPNHQPMLLFPCGHNLCRSCLFEDVPKGYSKKEPKRQHTSCPLCRQVIISHVLNRNLMNLICIYSDNRNLIEKELE